MKRLVVVWDKSHQKIDLSDVINMKDSNDIWNKNVEYRLRIVEPNSYGLSKASSPVPETCYTDAVLARLLVHNTVPGRVILNHR